MTIPPFPSQDLAKLVLGYLAEEQLMTAYDEFLQASPYLDALRNEYDRIFMTSLKSILAEYRAVKIYVDTCRPFALRKKIFQCSNLLDVVKLLVNNVDINKIQLQEAMEKASQEKQNITITPKPMTCEVCNYLKLTSCVCTSRHEHVYGPENQSASHVEASCLQTSVETTPLEDLPGNHITTKRKHVKVLEKDSIFIKSNMSSESNSGTAEKQSFSNSTSPEENLTICSHSSQMKGDNLSFNLTVKATDASESRQKIEEFNDILKSVVKKNKSVSGGECAPNQRISNASTFQDFASGVPSGESQSATYNVPDSSTSENTSLRVPLAKENYSDTIKGSPTLLLQVSQVNDKSIQSCRDLPKLVNILPKSAEQKIKIISDVKVGNKYTNKDNDGSKKKPVLKNATSTPLMQMQTILINGKPVYKHPPVVNHTYTKDEIMAMPTLIVVSGPSKISTVAHSASITTQSHRMVSTQANSGSPRVLGPLVIDVPSSAAQTEIPTVTSNLPDLSNKPVETSLVETGLVKTVDCTKNATVPKDNVTSMASKTPQVLPPTRKSSSTPRRTSHVRVLDFATPRRILHETINEQVISQSENPPVEIVVAVSPNELNTNTTSTQSTVADSGIAGVQIDDSGNNDGGSAKENNIMNKLKPPKKYDWDADLRALVANDKNATALKSRPRKSSKKKKNTDNQVDSDKTEKKKSRGRKKASPNVSKAKKRRTIEDDGPAPDPCKNKDVPLVPTINIIRGNDSGNKADLLANGKEDDDIKTRLTEKDEENVETPEGERLSLQNVIGAKLNISDFLETPYKQVLYDIQMDTPKFLGPDLPDVEPLSDIKIMNIPTPRFLNSQNVQATPSYSSHATDYSSGGSYYKPDDHYMPIPDLRCPVSSSKEDISEEKTPEEKISDEKKSRPVRQCTKNVSYYRNSSVANKIKEAEENIDATSSSSEDVSNNISFDVTHITEGAMKTPRDKSKSIISESAKRNTVGRPKKSPATKDKSRSFMKIKPRYTPKTECTSTRQRKKGAQSAHNNTPNIKQRRGATSKEKQVNATPLITAAPTKSRRKSSTPRKLHCTKTFNSESSGHNSPEIVTNPKLKKETHASNLIDSDTEHLALRWSDDGSQDANAKDTPSLQSHAPMCTSANEIEDITKIKEFIDSSTVRTSTYNVADDGTKLQENLVKRGFDLVTAKKIERDLLDDAVSQSTLVSSNCPPLITEGVIKNKNDQSTQKTVETDSIVNELHLQEEEEEDDLEFSVHECNEESTNYIVCEYDDTKEMSQEPPIKLKDNYTMELCIDDGVTLRLRATPFNFLFDQEPLTVDEIDYSYKETERAVSSIINIDRLYTPLKESMKSQCYEIFDSTLTSLDTPLKAKSPVRKECLMTVTELVLEEEKQEAKEKTETKKRKRLHSDESTSDGKKAKPDAQYLFNSANIQNIDIESVLTKLHGP